MPGGYELIESRTSVADFHRRVLPVAPRVWHHIVAEPALVLGSTQPASDVAADEARRTGVDVVRRRSGGGAVLLVPGEVTWIDVVLPRDAEGWSDDVHGPMRWLGDHLAAVFAGVLPGRSVTAHHGGPVTTLSSRTVCFDGLGTGEVLVDGIKLVGMSQRRTRESARLQCCWHHDYDAADLVGLLQPHVRPALGELRPVATVAADVAADVAGTLAARL